MNSLPVVPDDPCCFEPESVISKEAGTPPCEIPASLESVKIVSTELSRDCTRKNLFKHFPLFQIQDQPHRAWTIVTPAEMQLLTLPM